MVHDGEEDFRGHLVPGLYSMQTGAMLRRIWELSVLRSRASRGRARTGGGDGGEMIPGGRAVIHEPFSEIGELKIFNSKIVVS